MKMPNPLLAIDKTIPFDCIQPQHIEPALSRLLAEAQANLQAVSACNEPRTFTNTMLAFDRATENLSVAYHIVRHLEIVKSSQELRLVFERIEPLMTKFYSSIYLSEDLWRAIKGYSETEEAAGLQGARKRFLDLTLLEFKRHGAELTPSQKQRLLEIDLDLAQCTTKFRQNILDATKAYELLIADEKQLAGLPPRALEAARQSAAEKGLKGLRLTLQIPSYIAALKFVNDAEIRQTLYRAYNTIGSRAPYDNSALVLKILNLRKEKAQLLGYRDFADLVCADRMVKDGPNAFKFVDNLVQRVRGYFKKEIEALQAFRIELEGPATPPLRPWDVAYYAEKLKQRRFNFNEEDLRPYFPLPQVLQGLFRTVEKLFSVRIEALDGLAAWHPDVKSYALHDAGGGLLGHFYMDLYPREEKRGGAWMDAFICGGPREGGFKPHVGFIGANFNRPIGNEPALLNHAEVETLFHEFGHLLHQLLSKVELIGLAGTSVPWDFVELPSQIMENWCWERESLDLFARHVQSAEPLPQGLFRNLAASRTFLSACEMMRQLGFAYTDLKLHREYDAQRDGSLVHYAKSLLQEFAVAPLPEDYAMILSFGHLFSEGVAYAAGYYSYKWAEVLDADAFSRFKAEGLFSPAAGRAFRETILELGNSRPPEELFRSFLGRDPDVQALLRRAGLE